MLAGSVLGGAPLGGFLDASAAGVPANTKIIWPLYEYPVSGSSWDWVIANPTGIGYIIANDRNGELTGLTADANYAAYIASARAAGLKIMYYVRTSWGTRASSLVLTDMAAWISFYGAPDGWFMNESSTSSTYLTYYQTLYTGAAGKTVCLNFGGTPDELYFSTAGTCDIGVVQANSEAVLATTALPTYINTYARDRFCVFDYSAADLVTPWNRITAQNVGWIYITDIAGFTSKATYIAAEEALVLAYVPVGVSTSEVWSVRSVVGKSSTDSWSVRFAVGKSSTGVWSVQTSLGVSSTEVWSVRTPVGSSETLVWNVRAPVGKSSSEVWSVRSAQGVSSTEVWNVRAPVGKSSSEVWSVHSQAGKSSSEVWSVHSQAGKSSSTPWTVRSSLGTSVTTPWSVRSASGKSSSTPWSVRTSLGVSSTEVWSLRAPVSKSSASVWSVRASVGASETLVWNVLAIATLGVSNNLRWDVRAPVGKTSATSWSVRTSLGVSSTAQWGVRIALGKSSSEVWSVRALSGKSSALVWDARSQAFVSTSFPWAIHTKALVGNSLIWSVRGVTGLQTSLVWMLLSHRTASDVWALATYLPRTQLSVSVAPVAPMVSTGATSVARKLTTSYSSVR